MRIGYISYEYPPDSSVGGIATYVAQAARMMHRRGHEVEVFASSPSRNGRFEIDGILVHWIRETNRQDFGIVAGHVFAMRHAENRFDVLEGPEFNADARKAVELVPDIPLVVKMHTPSALISILNSPTGFPQYVKEIRKNFRSLMSAVVRMGALQQLPQRLKALRRGRYLDTEGTHAQKADLVAPPCSDLCGHAMLAWKVGREAIRLSPHPYEPSEEFLALTPRDNGLVVGYVGRLEKRKGIETLAQAIPGVLKAVPGARFRFVGAAAPHPDTGVPYDDWLRRVLPQHREQLEFTGKLPQERIAQAYAGLDLCVFPSLWENFPNVCLEAMSAGRAIVASNCGGMTEMLDHGRAGHLVKPGDSVSLARKIIGLLRDPAERIRLGRIARKRLLEEYNENVIGDLMEQIYREAIGRKAEKKRLQSDQLFTCGR